MWAISTTVMVIFSQMPFWKLLDHSYVQSFFSIITRHINYNILKGTLLLKILRTWIKIPVGTGCKLNVHKTFRRRPGRLLKVLCTFNLRHVSTGIRANSFIKTSVNIKKWKSMKVPLKLSLAKKYEEDLPFNTKIDNNSLIVIRIFFS